MSACDSLSIVIFWISLKLILPNSKGYVVYAQAITIPSADGTMEKTLLSGHLGITLYERKYRWLFQTFISFDAYLSSK